VKVEVENGSGLTRKLSVEIPAQTFNTEMEKKLSELRRTVTLKGFRKGNAPIDMIRSQFGDQVKADVVDELFRQSLSNAIDTHKMKIAGRPTVTDLDLAEDGTMTYKAEIEVFPEIDKVVYEGLTLQAPELKVEDAEVNVRPPTMMSSWSTWSKCPTRRTLFRPTNSPVHKSTSPIRRPSRNSVSFCRA
jgi:trigger factor